jgi:hypothetical protein
MDKRETTRSVSMNLLPFAVAFPLLCIAFWGCFEGGCQGALNAQSEALHEAYEAGGWRQQGSYRLEEHGGRYEWMPVAPK